MLLCIGIYVWASLALGWRASNLTNRGIVTTGPYRWLRHPAYAAKNVSWWIGATPLVIRFAYSDPWRLTPVIVGTAAWSESTCCGRSPKSDTLGAIPTTRPTAPGFVALLPGVGLTFSRLENCRLHPELRLAETQKGDGTNYLTVELPA